MPFRLIPINEDAIRRFWTFVYIRDDGHWQWLGQIVDGYGRFTINHSPWGAHRVSYAIFHGQPGELTVCHKCDRPWCVCPFCLFLGTAEDNAQDYRRKQFNDPVYIRRRTWTLSV
jgi:hypothetical protein